jgi:hypothetical protein
MVLDSLRHVLIHNYLKNKELNHFYVSIFLIHFGVSLISLFVPMALLNKSLNQVTFFTENYLVICFIKKSSISNL